MRVRKNLELLNSFFNSSNFPLSMMVFNEIPRPKKPGTFCFSWLQLPTNGIALKSSNLKVPDLPRFEGLLPIFALA